MAQAITPHVACVMLTTNTRPKLMARAVRCFKRQTYANRSLLILNSGTTPVEDRLCCQQSILIEAPWFAGQPIGSMRNLANSMAHKSEVICHWDDDDYSYPHRIREQIETLQATQGQVVGFNEMMFWRHVEKQAWQYSNKQRNYALGTSLCYWREVWRRDLFDALPTPGEDTRWLANKRVFGLSGNNWMVASIHEQNTSPAYDLRLMRAVEAQGGEWKRSESMDSIIGTLMEMK
jgi:hypothetical protein